MKIARILSMLFVIAIILATQFLLPVVAQDMIDNPIYHSWAKFKPGTRVTFSQTSEIMQNKSESQITYELIEVSQDKVVVELSGTTTLMGKKTDMPKTRLEYYAKTKTSDPDAQNAVKAQAASTEESLEIMGEKLICKVLENTIQQQGSTIKIRYWYNNNIPGSFVKSETIMENPIKTKTVMILIDKIVK